MICGRLSTSSPCPGRVGEEVGAFIGGVQVAHCSDTDLTVTDGSRVTATDSLTLSSEESDLTLSNNAVLVAGNNLEASAGGDITMDASSAMESGADLTLATPMRDEVGFALAALFLAQHFWRGRRAQAAAV